MGASTAAKKKMEPVQRVSESRRMKRRKVTVVPPECSKGEPHIRQRKVDVGHPRRKTMLQRYGNAVHYFAQDLLGLLGALERGRIARADDEAVRKGWHGELFEVIGDAEVASLEECHGLGGVIEHERAAGRDS